MIDLRSDTVTKPTAEMRKASYEAVVGDDVYEEDPTVIELEEKAAEMLGKEAALFVTSGTQGNQIAVLTHCQPGNEVIMEAEAHIYYYEGGAISAFAGVQPRTLHGKDGVMDPRVLQAAIRPDDIHMPETGLICLENTHNRAGGAVVPLENMKAIYEIAVAHQIPVHLDGARLFNAATALGVSVKEIAQYTDTVQICLSKGLGAPVGSIIAGEKSFIKRARKWRKRLGGGMRQAGIIAAPAYIALTKMPERLEEDHQHAKLLAAGLAEVHGITIENNVDTNIVLVNVENRNMTAADFVSLLKENGILAVAFGPYTVRMTTHYDVTRLQIQETIEAVSNMLNG